MALTVIFVASIFLGSVWLGKITLPFSILILPLLFLSRRQMSLRIPSGAVLLMILGTIITLQFGLYHANPAFRWKADLAVWLPVVFAGLTIMALRVRTVSDRLALWSMVSGGMATAAIMLGMILFAPNGMFLLPGQNASSVEAQYATQIATEQATLPTAEMTPTARPVPAGMAAFSPKDGDKGFYDVKNRARSFLGLSNYIAVFMVFLFAAALFCGLPLAATGFAVFTVLTLSRFGIAMLLVVLVIYLARSRHDTVRASAWAASTISLGLVILYALRGFVLAVPGLASLMARFEYWRSGIEALSLHPLLGAPRSVYLVEMGNSITWNPHNSILWMTVNFGLLGSAAYCAYIWIAMREITRAAASSDLWRGVFVGMVIVLAWSLEEIIVLTPAFEILLAALYALALNKNRAVACLQTRIALQTGA